MGRELSGKKEKDIMNENAAYVIAIFIVFFITMIAGMLWCILDKYNPMLFVLCIAACLIAVLILLICMCCCKPNNADAKNAVQEIVRLPPPVNSSQTTQTANGTTVTTTTQTVNGITITTTTQTVNGTTITTTNNITDSKPATETTQK